MDFHPTPSSKRELAPFIVRKPFAMAEFVATSFSGIKLHRLAHLTTGSRMHAILPDTVSTSVVLTGDFEPEVTHTMRSLLRPGDVLMNIGAHFGLRVLQAQDIIGCNGVIYAFEPTPDTRKILSRNCQGLDPEVSILPVALGDRSGTATLFDLGCAYSGSNTVDSPPKITGRTLKRRPAPQSIDVPMTTLDCLMGQRQILPPSLIVMDAEGSEGAIITGGINTLDRFHPPMIFEYGNQETDHPLGGVDVLRALGYKLWDMSPRGSFADHVDEIAQGPKGPQHRNVLAMHPLNYRGGPNLPKF